MAHQLEKATLDLQKLALEKTRISRDLQNKKIQSQANLLATQMGVSPSVANLGKGGELPDVNRPQTQYYSRPRSGNDDGSGIMLGVRGKKGQMLTVNL